MSTPAITPPKNCVAVFDFDGTLTERDTLRLFYRQCAGPAKFFGAVIVTLPTLLTASRSAQHREYARRKMTAAFLKGRSRREVDTIAAMVAERITARELRNDVCARLAWHRAAGHEIVIISASFAPYIEPVAKRLGVETVLATRWEVGADDCLTGDLWGPNVWGDVKVRELLSFLVDRHPFIYAYGDSEGDEPLLNMADAPTWIGKGRITRAPSPVSEDRAAS